MKVGVEWFFSYNLEKRAFEPKLETFWLPSYSDNLQEDIACYTKKAKHVIDDILWFDYLPLKAINALNVEIYQHLILNIDDKKLALDIERARGNLEIWIGFKLSGNFRKITYPSWFIFEGKSEKFLEAIDAVVMLINKENNKVVWWKKY